MENLTQYLLASLDRQGYKAKIVSAHPLDSIGQSIIDQHSQGMIHGDLYHRYLDRFQYDLSGIHFEAKSIIIIAVPQSITQIAFQYHNETYTAIVPPTYIHYGVDEQIYQHIFNVLHKYDYHIANARLPLKLLAVHSGLGAYGRNNICYIAGMGSFHRLMAFISDLPPETDQWSQPYLMKTCEQCSACVKSCPTASIRKDRFLLYGEKCLTHINENDGAFPDWVDPQWHNALVGCMLCQNICPENKNVIGSVTLGASFTHKETQGILCGLPKEHLSPTTQEKLDQLCLTEYYNVLPRNLSVLIEQKNIATGIASVK